MNKKRGILALGAIVLVTICAVAFYFRTYPIKLNMVTLDWKTIGEHRGDDESLTVLGTGMSIDRKEFYLISVDGQFGYVSFERGPFGRHRLRNVGYGDGDFRNGIIESEGKKYLLFSGVDSGGDIDKITVKIGEFSYDLTPLKSRPFLTYCEVDPNIKARNVNLFDITFYDEVGNNITSNNELSGGQIQ